ncbi:2713_t:CDS:2, partial [Racocetra persica]
QNKDPCKVKDCDNNDVTHYHKFTTYAKEKLIAKIHLMNIINDKWKDITIDIINDEIILNKDDFIKLINRTNQLEIFQAENQNLNRDLNILSSTLNFENKLDLLSKILFKKQRRLNNPIELDLKKFLELITKSNFLLEGFFDKIFNAISPRNIRCFSTRYHSSFPPILKQCDAYKKDLVETTEENKFILICGHGYHLD